MSASVANIHSETGWDALADELPMVVRVMSSPATLEELAEVVGERDLVRARRRAARLVREGVIVLRGDRYEAPARMIDTDRQEGMLTSISRYVLPHVMKLANDPTDGVAIQLDLDLDEAEQEALCVGWEKSLVDELNELSDRPAESKEPHTLIVYGTSDVPPAGPPSERMIETLRRCARQRSTPELASRALLIRYDAHIGHPAEAMKIVRRAAARMDAKAPGHRYTLVYGFCANGRIDGEGR